jgi:hypothetical protein
MREKVDLKETGWWLNKKNAWLTVRDGWLNKREWWLSLFRTKQQQPEFDSSISLKQKTKTTKAKEWPTHFCKQKIEIK